MRPTKLFMPLCIFLLSFLLPACGDDSNPSSKNLYQIKKPGIISITESGQLGSINNTFIVSPGDWNMEYRIAYMAKEGSFVQEGDTVVKFNTETAQSELDEALAKLEIQREKYNEVLKENEVGLKEKENALIQLEWQYKINLNKAEQAKFESDVHLQEAELELKKTLLSLSKAKDNLSSYKIISQKKADLVHLEIRQENVKIQRARNKMADMYLISPKGGMVIYQKQGWGGDGEKIKVGDSVWPRSPIMAIPDLAAMQVTIKLNEVDRPLVKEGQQAKIQIEAYSDTLFDGRVNSISKIVEVADGLNTLKTYDMVVHLKAGDNYRLKPGLSAIVNIEIDSAANVYEVPSWCVGHKENMFYINEADAGNINIELYTLRDGKAYITGDIKETMQLKAIF